MTQTWSNYHMNKFPRVERAKTFTLTNCRQPFFPRRNALKRKIVRWNAYFYSWMRNWIFQQYFLPLNMRKPKRPPEFDGRWNILLFTPCEELCVEMNIISVQCAKWKFQNITRSKSIQKVWDKIINRYVGNGNNW